MRGREIWAKFRNKGEIQIQRREVWEEIPKYERNPNARARGLGGNSEIRATFRRDGVEFGRESRNKGEIQTRGRGIWAEIQK